MCSLNHAIDLYRENDKPEDNKKYVIVKKGDELNIPLKNKLYDNFKEADIDRIYYQPDYTELLKVITI